MSRRQKYYKTRRYNNPRLIQNGNLRKGGYWGRYNKSNGFMREELKFFDTTQTVLNFFTTGTVNVSLNLIPQGTTESTRLGRKCIIKSIQLRLQLNHVRLQSSEVATGDTMRVILLLDRQANGVVPSVASVLETTNYQSFYNLANNQRFAILFDKIYDFHHPSGAGDGSAANDWSGQQKTILFAKALHVPIEFSGTAGAIAEIASNNLVILFINEFGSVSTYKYICRVRFVG